MASSSSSAAAISSPRRKYDVFLSFRGEDTRNTFTSHLHAALLRKKLDTYIDNKLGRGDEIGPALLEAIEKSKLSVIIFSKNYASSTWCLDELVHILRCKERDGQFVIPVFYDISPQDVRKQQGSYADAFAKLEERFKLEEGMYKVLKWRNALEKAANLSGYDYSNKAGTEADSIEKFVQVILNKLDCKSSSDLKGLVEIETKVKQIESLLCLDSRVVCSVGIWGMGGIGKTTLADVVYHRLSSKFEACCFLKNVRENSEGKDGIYNLRNKLLCKILGDENTNIDTPSIGSELLKERLRRTKVLIVLDDVNDSRQLEFLVGDDLEFGVGSRIIITTRDRSLLKEKVVDDKIYEVNGLQHDEALQLFHLHALKNKSPTTVYTEFSRKVIDYIQGIPLALKTLGALFRCCDTEEDWDEELNRLKKFPSEKIQNVLRLSYDGLEENEKECFLKGKAVYYAKRILDIRGFFVKGIQILIDKSLISISETNCIEMHDLLQEMGRTIVREQCRDEPGKRNRLWAADDVYQVLENDTGTSAVQCISFDTSNITRLELCGSAFKKMSNLRLLVFRDPPLRLWYSESYKTLDPIPNSLDLSQGLQSLPNSLRYLYWQGYPLKSLPSNFSPQNLVELQMPSSFVEKLWSKNQNLGNLEVIELSFCTHLTEVPDLSRSKKIKRIVLFGCERLVRIPSYFKDLDKLRWLNLGACRSLEFLPELPVLCCLEASGCTSLKTVSSSRNSLTQAWDKYELFRGRFNFVDCRNLDGNARTNIMADTQLRIMRVATGLLKTQQHKEEEIVMEMTSSIPTSCRTLGSTISNARTLVSTVCAGNEIPNWFCHQNEGSSITIKLPRYWYCTDFLGFALSVVLQGSVYSNNRRIRCSCNFKTDIGESHKTYYPYHYPSNEVRLQSALGHIIVWYGALAL